MAIRQEEPHPLFVEFTKRTYDSPQEYKDGFAEILEKANPMTERMARRVNDWLHSGNSEPPDEAKLARMQELFGETSNESSKGVDNA